MGSTKSFYTEDISLMIQVRGQTYDRIVTSAGKQLSKLPKILCRLYVNNSHLHWSGSSRVYTIACMSGKIIYLPVTQMYLWSVTIQLWLTSCFAIPFRVKSCQQQNMEVVC